jgi:tetratricopeptide (TPR) repeat protein
MKKLIILFTIFIFMSCGVPKKEHEQMKEDLENKIVKLENDKVKLENQVKSLESQLDQIKYGAERLYKKGTEFYNNKKYKEAKSNFDELFKRHPESEEAKKSKSRYAQVKTIVAKIEKNEKAKAEADRKRRAKEAWRKSCDIELISWNWVTEYGYVKARGQVKNISNQSLKNVQALATYYDKNGNFISSDDAIIKYNPILPGQTSPFETITTYNPAMKKAAIEFKIMWGKKLKTFSK